MIGISRAIFFIIFSVILSSCANEPPLNTLSDRELCTLLHSRDGVAEELNYRMGNGTITVTHDECIMISVYSAGSYYPPENSDTPCDCPDDLDSSGNRCGERSAWSIPGGRAPICNGIIGQ